MPRAYAFYKGRFEENPTARYFDQLVTSWPKTKGRFSHTERVVFGTEGRIVGLSSSGLDGGVRSKEIDFNSGKWVFVEVPGDNQKGIAKFEAEKGKPYDTLGLLGFILPFTTQNPSSWFCSEINAYMEDLEKPHTWHPNRLFDYLATQPGAKVSNTI